jgi:hypothetical protein
MNTGFLITGLVILLVANILMLFVTPGQLSPSKEGFSNYYLANAGGAAPKGQDAYQAIGAFDGVRLDTGNNVSSWRYTKPNEPLMGPEFEPGNDSLFIFKNNQCKPECCGASFSCGGGCVCTTPQQRQYIAGRGQNRTEPAGEF